MAKAIPGQNKQQWYQSKTTIEVVGGLPPCVVAGVAAYRLLTDQSTRLLGYISVCAAIWLLIAAILKVAAASRSEKKEEKEFEHDGILAALYVLHACVSRVCEITQGRENDVLRVTFHRVKEPLAAPTEYEQLVSYVGRSGGVKGRINLVNVGIVGRAIREKGAYADSRGEGDSDAYKKELVSRWGYTAATAEKVSTDSHSWMAVPISDAQGTVLGVVYLDGTEKSMFEAEERRASIIVACSGITKYVDMRYK